MTAKKVSQAALQESVDAVAVSSYNGGHLEFFPQLLSGLQQVSPSPLLLSAGRSAAGDRHRHTAATQAKDSSQATGGGKVVCRSQGTITGRIGSLLTILEHPPQKNQTIRHMPEAARNGGTKRKDVAD